MKMDGLKCRVRGTRLNGDNQLYFIGVIEVYHDGKKLYTEKSKIIRLTWIDAKKDAEIMSEDYLSL